MSLGSVTPSEGGRVMLRLKGTEQETVRYEVTCRAREIEWVGSVTVTASDGFVQFAGMDGAPAWLVEVARTILRGAWRNRANASWPRRVTRWREAPDGPSRR